MTEIFSNNLINWILLVLILGYMWMKITPAMFAERKNKIDGALNEAEKARVEGQEFFKKQEARIANAEEESKSILEDAEKMAAVMKAEIEKQTETETKSLSDRITQQISAEYQQAITEMRSRTATVAVRLAEASLPGAITDSAKSRLLGEFVEQLDNGGLKK
jgi:F-type H+-transporting ATPase subunit b